MKQAASLLRPCAAGYLQFDVRQGEPAVNLASLREGLARLNPAGPGVIVLPEMWSCGFAYDRLAAHALETEGLLEQLRQLAAGHGVYLAGSLPEAVLSEIDTVVHNTLFVVGPEGQAGRFRKQQLFAPMAEDKHFTAGDNPRAIATELGLLAGLVCFDLRFPELAGCQAAQGAGLLLVSAQWPEARLTHWRTLLTARAIENQMFVAACNRCGTTGDTPFAGHSMVIAPDGEILAEAGSESAAAFVSLDPLALSRVRHRFNTVAPAPYRFFDQDKILTPAELGGLMARYRAVGRRVVFTNGCFDILHQGHVSYLEEARGLGDCLIVGVNSDSSVRRLGKGPDRPVNHEQSRARLLAALGCVDHVVIFDEETPLGLITAIMPDVLVKGGDWPVETIVGASEVLAAGGRVLSLPLVGECSTTGLLARIRGQG